MSKYLAFNVLKSGTVGHKGARRPIRNRTIIIYVNNWWWHKCMQFFPIFNWINLRKKSQFYSSIMFNNQQNLNTKYSIFLDFIKDCNPAMLHQGSISTFAQKYSKTDHIKNFLGKCFIRSCQCLLKISVFSRKFRAFLVENPNSVLCFQIH